MRGWTFLQAGDLKNAEREFTLALKTTPAFYPRRSASATSSWRAGITKAALTHFDRALERQAADPSALVGRGEANLALNREAEALAAFEAAIAADPSLTEIAQRVEVLKFRLAEQRLADARAAAAAGRIDEAIRVYTIAIASSPGSAFLYRELAGVERQKGDAASALAHFRRALDLDPADAGSLTGIGELLEAARRFRGRREGVHRCPRDRARRRRFRRNSTPLRARAALAQLPANTGRSTWPRKSRGESWPP